MPLLSYTAGVLGLLVSISVASEPHSEQPQHRIGDTWTFRMVSSPGDVVTEWSRTVVGMPQPNRLRIRIENGQEFDYTVAGTRIRPRGEEYSRELMKFPIFVGQRWEYARKAGQNGDFEEKGSGVVLAYEKLTVPAGTFDCFRHDVESWETYTRLNLHTKFKRWYCPEIRWIAKEDVNVEEWTPYGPAHRTSSVSELTSFRLAQ